VRTKDLEFDSQLLPGEVLASRRLHQAKKPAILWALHE
jgi:hypothetical protein